MLRTGIRLGENNHTRCVAMQEIATSDRAELALRKESRCRDGTKPFLHGSAIVMGLVEESLSTPATAEHKSPERGALVLRCGPLPGAHVNRRLQTSHREGGTARSGLLERHLRSQRLRPVDPLRSGSERGSLPARNGFHAHRSRSPDAMRDGHRGAVSPHGFEDVLKPFQGRDATQFIDEILLRSRHDKPFADRTAAL